MKQRAVLWSDAGVIGQRTVGEAGGVSRCAPAALKTLPRRHAGQPAAPGRRAVREASLIPGFEALRIDLSGPALVPTEEGDPVCGHAYVNPGGGRGPGREAANLIGSGRVLYRPLLVSCCRFLKSRGAVHQTQGSEYSSLTSFSPS